MAWRLALRSCLEVWHRRLTLPGLLYVTSNSLPCYESAGRLASLQRSSLLNASWYLLGASHGLFPSCHHRRALRRWTPSMERPSPMIAHQSSTMPPLTCEVGTPSAAVE